MKLPAPSSNYDAGNEAQTRRAIEQEDARNLKHSGGFWLPTLFGTTTPGSPTYVRQEGWWTRVDDMIIAPFRVEISAIGGMAGDLGLRGSLPVSFPTSPSRPCGG